MALKKALPWTSSIQIIKHIKYKASMASTGMVPVKLVNKIQLEIKKASSFRSVATAPLLVVSPVHLENILYEPYH